MHNNPSVIILLSCPDRVGIVAEVSAFVKEQLGNILHLEQHVDRDSNTLFMRLQSSIEGDLDLDQIEENFKSIAERFNANYQIKLNGVEKPRVAIMVSKHLHCLLDLLWRHELGEIDCEFPLIISNHADAAEIAANFGIDYHHLSVTPENKSKIEAQQIKLLKEHNIDLIVMARYMQILSNDFIQTFPDQIINIHHSFLPAFMGGNPYKQALERGVKVIGATSHYATEDLDEGPIIEQDIIRISHRDSLDDLKSKGRDLEKIVLARAVKAHLESRVLTFGRRTIVFDK